MGTAIVERTISLLNLSDDGTVTLRFKGATKLVVAKALEARVRETGEIEYLCLDRLVHRQGENVFGVDVPEMMQARVQVSGCVATELLML